MIIIIRYKYLADKERLFLDQLQKVNREMVNLTSAMLDDSCGSIDETMKSVYKTDYAKRGKDDRMNWNKFGINSIRWNDMNFRVAHQRVQAVESCGRFGLLFTVSGGNYRDKRGLQRSNEISIHGHRKTTYTASKNDHFLPRYQIFSYSFIYILVHVRNKVKMYS